MTKLVTDRYGTQIGWLYPAALLSLAIGLWRYRSRPRTDPVRGGFYMWGGWLAVTIVVLSGMGIPHTAYVAILSPALAALSAAGIAICLRADDTPEWPGWVFPAMIVAEVAWAAYLSRHHLGFLPWLVPLVVAAAIVALAVLAATRLWQRPTRRMAMIGAVAGLVAILAAPATWAALVLDPAYAGRSFEATVGPFPLPPITDDFPLAPDQRQLLSYTTAHRAGATYLFATDAQLGEYYIRNTGAMILPMGGFTGTVAHPTLRTVQQMVRAGRLHFFLFRADNGPGAGAVHDALTQIHIWVQSSCLQILPASVYGGAPDKAVLYQCTTAK